MNLELTERERKSEFAELKAEYLYIAIPFVLLVAVKLYIGVWEDIILSPEWALAACLIFGQITAKVAKVVANPKSKTNDQNFTLYMAIKFFWVFTSITTYFFMLLKPTMFLGCVQIIIFFWASVSHFKDGFAVRLLYKNM